MVGDPMHHTSHNHDQCNLCGHEDSHSLKDEILCHVPFACIALSISFILLATFHFIGMGIVSEEAEHSGYHILFHSFHYLHIVVAVAGSVIAFFRRSQRFLLGSLLTVIIPTVSCVASDILLPTLSGRLLGADMEMHVCFFDPYDALNLVAFMLIGYICGMTLLHNKDSLRIFSLTFHFFHILISSMASTFYMVAHGFEGWYESMGILYLFLFLAVIIPCTVSDVVMPLLCARAVK